MICYLDAAALRRWQEGCPVLAELTSHATRLLSSQHLLIDHAKLTGERPPMVLLEVTPAIIEQAAYLRRECPRLDSSAAIHLATALVLASPELVAAFADPVAARWARKCGLVTAALHPSAVAGRARHTPVAAGMSAHAMAN
ncbi:hypothetical protein [Gephyromycinifex aptenodytis]|uniref:hypothetical protein n=1 Tax=Gephyromycinifex aptenodytis TaxID=2716227 RepID=UPI00144542E4|nr:hypothetical protein [Gephyromycinifex aptenodytis]